MITGRFIRLARPLTNTGISGWNPLFRTVTANMSTTAGRSGAAAAAAGAGVAGALGKYRCRRFEGKVAVVTASTAGIGYAIAERLAHEGAHVIISSRKQEQVTSAVRSLEKQGLAVTGITCHVGNKADRKKLLDLVNEKFNGLDILVANAGINPAYGNILETKEESWDKIFDINLKSSFLICQEAVPLIEKKGGGSVIFVSSIAAFDPFPLIAPYSISKTALLGLVKALVPQCAEKKIRVNAIAPGIIKTKFSQALWSDEGANQAAEGRIPLNRLGTAEDCSGAVAFLASDDASFITGETIVMAGGVQSRL